MPLFIIYSLSIYMTGKGKISLSHRSHSLVSSVIKWHNNSNHHVLLQAAYEQDLMSVTNTTGQTYMNMFCYSTSNSSFPKNFSKFEKKVTDSLTVFLGYLYPPSHCLLGDTSTTKPKHIKQKLTPYWPITKKMILMNCKNNTNIVKWRHVLMDHISMENSIQHIAIEPLTYWSPLINFLPAWINDHLFCTCLCQSCLFKIVIQEKLCLFSHYDPLY